MDKAVGTQGVCAVALLGTPFRTQRRAGARFELRRQCRWVETLTERGVGTPGTFCALAVSGRGLSRLRPHHRLPGALPVALKTRRHSRAATVCHSLLLTRSPPCAASRHVLKPTARATVGRSRTQEKSPRLGRNRGGVGTEAAPRVDWHIEATLWPHHTTLFGD